MSDQVTRAAWGLIRRRVLLLATLKYPPERIIQLLDNIIVNYQGKAAKK